DNLWYDLATGESYGKVTLTNADSECMFYIESLASDEANTAVAMLQTDCLVEQRDAGKLSGKLKELAANLKDDDNPVIMKVKF
ncbi:MAG: hypothetical protein LBR06_09025, partial [Bacteroidales bacterium]|nr:hypothetical protein [Bacteroidales bacterium]